MAWDPKTYLAFGGERTRAASDLLARIPLAAPKRVADLGCGPGNSTALLRARWPEAEIDGIDLSPEMLSDARASGIQAKFVAADIAQWAPAEPYDVIYTNAALQWLGDHERLIPRLFSFVAPGGVLAVQVPRNYDELCQVLLRDSAADPRWADRLKNVRDWWNGLAPEHYYDLLVPKADPVDLWETRYFHILQGNDAIFNWMMGTSLRPFVAALDSPGREEFLMDYRGRLAAAYPARPSGSVIHRFLRLFFVATRRA
ncbi:MAG TPA: trans-aconitate 2-methyltransferase [Micropepsaceae bacterium]|nr:trans-aconitate 2-methyltransferase [Micropepsaceae bacterium]